MLHRRTVLSTISVVMFLPAGLLSAQPTTAELAASLKAQVEHIKTLQGVLFISNAKSKEVSVGESESDKKPQSEEEFTVDVNSGYRFSRLKRLGDVELVSATDGAIWKWYEREGESIRAVLSDSHLPVAEGVRLFNLDDLKTGLLRNEFWTYVEQSEIKVVDDQRVSIRGTFPTKITKTKGTPHHTSFELHATLSTAHGGWPTYIDVWRTYPARLIQSRVRYADFFEYSPNHWIPTRVSVDNFSVRRHLPEGVSSSQLLAMPEDEYQKLKPHIRYTAERLGVEGYEAVLDVSTLQVNQPVDASEFKTFFPAKAEVIDRTGIPPTIPAPAGLCGPPKAGTAQ